jgi:hypothetical protein
MESNPTVVLQVNTNPKASGYKSNNLSFYFDINGVQVATLEKLKEKIQEENLTDLSNFDDLYLLKFLRARKFDLEKTYAMFKKFIEWRITNDIDNIEVKQFLNLDKFPVY